MTVIYELYLQIGSRWTIVPSRRSRSRSFRSTVIMWTLYAQRQADHVWLIGLLMAHWFGLQSVFNWQLWLWRL